MNEIWLGLATGIAFGILLQQGRVLRFEKQVGAMLLRDMTIMKFMLSAIVVGMIGLRVLADLDLIVFKIKPAAVTANLLGGTLFGVGWALVGFCPGTAVGALGEGRWHAVWAILGMLAGAALYAEVYPYIVDSLLAQGNLGPLALPEALGLTPWVTIGGLAVVVAILFAVFEKLKV